MLIYRVICNISYSNLFKLVTKKNQKEKISLLLQVT